MKKLVIGITAPSSVVLLEGQMNYFRNAGYYTYLIAPNHNRVVEFCLSEGCEHLPVEIEREISLLKDLKSFISVFRHFLKVKPDIVNLGTAKISFLGIVAAKIIGVKYIIYTCRGFRFEHEHGFKRNLLLAIDKLIGKFADKIICISESVRQLGVNNKIYKYEKTIVINKGSSNGLDLKRFDPATIDKEDIKKLKNTLNLTENNFVFGFVGRLIDRKGVNELFDAFRTLYDKNNSLRLLIVGPAEQKQLKNPDLIGELQSHPGIILTGVQKNVPLYMSLMDIFILPAWWEGFGNVLIQAAAMGLPVISTKATGTVDAVKDGFNGILIKPGAVSPLVECMEKLLTDHKTRKLLGDNGKLWAKNFDRFSIWKGMKDIYENKP